MSYFIYQALGFAILFPAIIGIIRFNNVRKYFLPFLLFIWIGSLNEILSIIITHYGGSNAISNNVYTLAEALLITAQFKKWETINSKGVYRTMVSLLICGWVVENLIISNISLFNSYFIIGYSFLIALLSIGSINKIISRTETRLWQNPIFIICIAFLIYFTYDILVESFWVYALNENAKFRISVYRIHTYINLFANLMYALAILWIRTRQKFTLPY